MRPLKLWSWFAGIALVVSLAAVPGSAGAAGCPNAVLFEPTSPTAILDAGWSGIAHDQPIFGTSLHLALTCGPSSPPCGTCPITGVVANPEGHRLRCRTDTSIECTVATEVADCGAADTCRYYLSPPQPLGAGGLPFCVTTEVNGTISGGVDVESGAFAPTVPVKAKIYDGIFLPPFPGGPNQGCPRCVGDPVANDTVRQGACSDGARSGLACDANATSPYPDFGSVSFDCPPNGTLEGQFTITLPFSTAPQTVTLTAASTLCTGAAGARCFCSTCNNAAVQPCATDADCPPSGGNPGICGGKRCLSGSNDGAPCAQNSECPGGLCNRPGEGTKPNACLDDTSSTVDCNPDVDGQGVCTAGPIDRYCTNHPNRGCLDDSDCDNVPASCSSKLRPCYLDNGVIGGSVTVDGAATAPVAGVASPTDIGAFSCLPPTTDAFINVWGLPGLGRIHQPGQLTFGDAIPAPTPTPPATPIPTVTPAPGLCPPAPDGCRAPIVAGKASVQLIDRSPDDKDQLSWKWTKGAATTVGELGAPVGGGDDYALCLYDGPTLRAALSIPAGGLCDDKPCWKAKSNGFLYKNKSATPHGITQLMLKAGLDGKAQMQAKGKGTLLPIPALPSLTGTLRVQLRNQTSGLCFGTTHVPPFDTATPERLKDRDD